MAVLTKGNFELVGCINKFNKKNLVTVKVIEVVSKKFNTYIQTTYESYSYLENNVRLCSFQKKATKRKSIFFYQLLTILYYNCVLLQFLSKRFGICMIDN